MNKIKYQKDMESKGWELISTGGNCLAYYKEINKNGSHYLLTDMDGCDIPYKLNQKAFIGKYDEQGIQDCDYMEETTINKIKNSNMQYDYAIEHCGDIISTHDTIGEAIQSGIDLNYKDFNVLDSNGNIVDWRE